MQHMRGLLFPPTVGELVPLGVAAQPADGQMCRLLHDVPELAGQRELSLAVHATGLHKHDLPAQGRPSQAYGYSGLA